MESIDLGRDYAVKPGQLSSSGMQKLALISALLVAASPVAAQVAMSNGQQQTGGRGGQSAPTQAPMTGVFCIEEMTATFCT